MGKRKTFPKVISCILVLVMLFTLAPGNLIHAFADEGVESAQSFTYVKLHFLNDKGYTTPAINCWDGSASDVEVTADGQVDIVAWGSKQHKMFTEEDDYYYATLKAVGSSGNITGIQIIDAPAEQSTFIQLDNTAMEAINDCKHSEGEEPTDLYCAYGKIYTNKVEGIGYTSPIVNEDGSVTIVYDMNQESSPQFIQKTVLLTGFPKDKRLAARFFYKDGCQQTFTKARVGFHQKSSGDRSSFAFIEFWPFQGIQYLA